MEVERLKKLRDYIRQLEEDLLKPEVRSSKTRLKEILADDFFNLGVQVKYCLRMKKFLMTV